MTLNNFTSGVNTTFSDELNGNFNTNNVSAQVPMSFLQRKRTAVLNSNDTIPLNPNIPYYINVELAKNDFSINASVREGDTTETTQDINSFVQGEIEITTKVYGLTVTLAVSDGNNDIILYQHGTGTNQIENKTIKGNIIHKNQDYLLISGEQEFFSEDLNVDDPTNDYFSEFNKASLSSLSTPYYFKLIPESGDYDSDLDLTINGITKTTTDDVIREYSVDGGSTYKEFSKGGFKIKGEDQIDLQVTNATIDKIIVRPIL